MQNTVRLRCIGKKQGAQKKPRERAGFPREHTKFLGHPPPPGGNLGECGEFTLEIPRFRAEGFRSSGLLTELKPGSGAKLLAQRAQTDVVDQKGPALPINGLQIRYNGAGHFRKSRKGWQHSTCSIPIASACADSKKKSYVMPFHRGLRPVRGLSWAGLAGTKT